MIFFDSNSFNYLQIYLRKSDYFPRASSLVEAESSERSLATRICHAWRLSSSSIEMDDQRFSSRLLGKQQRHFDDAYGASIYPLSLHHTNYSPFSRQKGLQLD